MTYLTADDGINAVIEQDRIRIILADDYPVVRAGIRQFIERDQAIQLLAEADDGVHALDLIRQQQPDVALLDLRMPGFTGIEVITRVRAEQLPTRCIVLTAFDDDPFVFSALAAGAKGYLLKTSGPNDLLRAIHLVHAGHSMLDPAITGHVIDRLSDPGASNAAEPPRLSEREMEVLRLVASGQTNRVTANHLGISERTVHSHLMNIFAKLGVNTRTEAALTALRQGWITLDETTV